MLRLVLDLGLCETYCMIASLFADKLLAEQKRKLKLGEEGRNQWLSASEKDLMLERLSVR